MTPPADRSPDWPRRHFLAWGLATAAGAGVLSGCAATRTAAPPTPLAVSASTDRARLQWIHRVGFGAREPDLRAVRSQGLGPWLAGQLQPGPAELPAEVQARIDAMRISRTPLATLARELDAERRAGDDSGDDAARLAARRNYQASLNLLARETRQRFVWRALYSPRLLQEQMVWFWGNHFNVSMRKANLRAYVADYEEQAIRPHALGRFRDLLGATVRHPAMLRYLDNAQNAARRVNENYARELMELHTLGVEGGYTQADVQTLARVLTGVGISMRPDDVPPNLPQALRSAYLRDGLFEFDPRRHDDGGKQFLGAPLTAQGMGEVDEALDRLARSNAAARFVSRRLAVHFVADRPSPELVDRMARRYLDSDGQIAAVLSSMFESPEFAASLGGKFRDPLQYVLAAVKLVDGNRVRGEVDSVIRLIERLGQPLYGRETPDGYALTRDAWASSGQMNARFEVAASLAGHFAGRDFDAEDPVHAANLAAMGPATRQALASARDPRERQALLLAAPETMQR